MLQHCSEPTFAMNAILRLITLLRQHFPGKKWSVNMFYLENNVTLLYHTYVPIHPPTPYIWRSNLSKILGNLMLMPFI
jgi:hypothetical protein